MKLELAMIRAKTPAEPRPRWPRCCGTDCEALIEQHGYTRWRLSGAAGKIYGGSREASKPGRCVVCREMTTRQVEAWPWPRKKGG